MFYLTDIPGYGLNSKDEWGEMMMKYFSYHKPQIKRVFVLKDVLHRLRAEDQRMVMLLEQEKMPYQVSTS
jgi:GTP-binding protein